MANYGNPNRSTQSGTCAMVTVTTTPTHLKVGSSPLAGRDSITLQAQGNNVYVGYSNSVSTSSFAIKIQKDQIVTFKNLTDVIEVWAVVASGSVDVAVSEVA